MQYGTQTVYSVYGGTYITHLNKVAVLQRKLLRLILLERKTVNIESEKIQAKILSVPKLYFYEIMKFAFRSVRSEVPADILRHLYKIRNKQST